MEKTYQSAGMFTRHIGGTNYKVKIHYCADAKENMQEKILRMIRNDIDFSEEPMIEGFQNNEVCGTINMLQTSRAA